jgi:3-oxoacyl-[acyl-carrier protein] reductase
MGRIDILVNNAGIYGPKGPTDSVDWAQWVQAINIILLGSVLMCHAVVGFEVKGPELLKE